MNADRLLALFEQISEAPDAIPRLRRFILDLAVRGKLVEQDPEDEPAEELLQRLKPAKSLACELEGLRKRQPVNSVSRGDLWFDMPADWALPCFDDLFVIVSGVTKGQRIPSSEAMEVPYLRVANVQRGSLDLSQIKKISVRAADVERYRLREQDILMTEGGDWDKLGRAAIWEGQIPSCIHQNHVFRLRVPTDELMPAWVVLYANSDPGRKFFEDCSKQTTNLASINLTQLRSCPLPLPPLAEQHRIVAKVDELMALCDQLEAASLQREQYHERLVAASLQRLNQPSDDPNTFHSDAHFALQVLPSLTSIPAQIKQLRQTILNLAVRGKLVEQDPEDEPAEELLTAVLTTPWQKKRKPIPMAFDDKSKSLVRPALPDSWTWTTVEAIVPPDETVTYGILKPVWVADGVPTVRVTEMKTGSIDTSRLPCCDPARAEKFRKTTLKEWDLLVSKDGTIGKTAFVPAGLRGGNITQHVIRLPISSLLCRPYIRIAIDSPYCQSYMRGETKGVALQGVNVGDFRKMPIPLPPLAEQHRIVAKVDALMALCDQLEQQLSQAEQSRRGLLEAVLREALAEPERMLTSAAKTSAA